MRRFLADAGIVVGVLVALGLVMAAAGESLPLASYLLGGSIGLTTAAARSYRRHLEAKASARALAARAASTSARSPKRRGKAS